MAVLAALLIALAGVSVSVSVAQRTDRYVFVETGRRLVRVDNATGQVARCVDRHDGDSCRLIADDRGMGMIDAMEGRLAALEDRLNGPVILGPGTPGGQRHAPPSEPRPFWRSPESACGFSDKNTRKYNRIEQFRWFR